MKRMWGAQQSVHCAAIDGTERIVAVVVPPHPTPTFSSGLPDLSLYTVVTCVKVCLNSATPAAAGRRGTRRPACAGSTLPPAGVCAHHQRRRECMRR